MFDLLSHDLEDFENNNSGYGQFQVPAGMGPFNGSEDKVVTFYVQLSRKQKVPCHNKQILELKVRGNA